MSNKKAVICSIIFYFMIFIAYMAVAFVSDVAFKLAQSAMGGILMYWWTTTFYRWLIRQEDS